MADQQQKKMVAESIIPILNAEGSGESAGFLNKIIALLWPNINIAGCDMVKQIVEPMFATMLPGPLKGLKFTKLDLGPVPLVLSKVEVLKTSEDQGIKVDMNVDWEGKCDVELGGHMIPKLGVKTVQLHGRLSILLCPLTNAMPLIGATQIAFINPPTLTLDYVGAADIADFSLIKKTVHGVLMNVIASMLVLPNRLMIKLDAANDYFKTYQHHLGVLRLTLEQASGLKGERSSRFGKLLDKVMKDIPDVYCRVNVGAEKDVWRTKTIKNSINPSWNETHDFLVMDDEQHLSIDLLDEDFGTDDNIGLAMKPVQQLLAEPDGVNELTIVKDGKAQEVKLKLRAQWLDFVPDQKSFSGPEAEAEDKAVSGRIAGLVTVLIANVRGLTGDKTKLHPSVKVQWGAKHEFQTAVMSYAPGVDIFNPGFDTAFRIPISAADLAGNPASFKISLMNAKTESGSVEVPFADVLAAPNMTKEDTFKVGQDGATVKASIWVRGTQMSK